ncbi:MAG: carboxypeptidase-like regulatory domain-containing protein, partial [Candidatus Acidiferrales bacterium]
MRKNNLLLLVWVLCIGLAAVSPGRADQLYGSIRGTVTDQTGAVIPGAKITATDVNTGISRQITSSSDGSFEFLNMLAPATYNVSVEKSGFRKFISSDIQLNVNQTYLVKAALEVGATTQQVTVQAAPAQVNTTSMQLGTTITGRTIVDLPLNGRNWVQLQQLQPGVVGATDRLGSDYSTNGAQTQQNSFLLNGVDDNEMALNTALAIPSPDAIAEFRMVTNTINPEYGRNSGAILNAII